MAAAYVLITCHPGTDWDVYDRVVKLKGVKTAESIAGSFDVIIRIESGSFEDISSKVLSEVRKIDGVRSTVTCFVVSR